MRFSASVGESKFSGRLVLDSGISPSRIGSLLMTVQAIIVIIEFTELYT
jgi:hypothetical protein